ncbi:hypothetical protein BDQ12DRAFT_130820 [Crucibulum laeve]|uniref:Uncharacterized protein n=1 Tax=Crucibulum laeve TaxID=68775 RepID=A0A5C3M0R4_9AGAR|nr:hypothetical protein BDQ12DRAFT_130820 [Crucibulum laeve]
MLEGFHANAGEVGYVQQQPNRLSQSQSVPKQMSDLNIHLPHANVCLGRGATSTLSPATPFFVSFLSAAQIAEAPLHSPALLLLCDFSDIVASGLRTFFAHINSLAFLSPFHVHITLFWMRITFFTTGT